jgi:hypothetical protein
MNKWLSLFIDLALPSPTRSRASETQWITVVTMRLAATLQGLDQLWVVSIAVMALDIALGAFVLAFGASQPSSRLPAALVAAPVSIGLLLSFAFATRVLRGRAGIQHGPSRTPEVDSSILVQLLEEAANRNLELLEWGWNGLQRSLILGVMGTLSSGVAILLVALADNVPWWLALFCGRDCSSLAIHAATIESVVFAIGIGLVGAVILDRFIDAHPDWRAALQQQVRHKRRSRSR